MGCKIKESDIRELQREILCKCRRTAESIAPCYEEADDVCQEEDVRDVDTSLAKDNGITKELPFEEILAEKRRKYTAKEEFIYLLYNDILPAFVTKWEGYFLRKKKPSTMYKNDVKIDDVNIGEGEEIDEPCVNDVSLIKEGKEEAHVLSWKSSLPDEFADISFYNDNSYSGRISRKMMEGEGTYKWHDGVRYKGQFEQNRIQGRGLLEWNDDRWYEGNFVDGLRHGEGVTVDKKRNHMHVCKWHMGKHKKMEEKSTEGVLAAYRYV